MGLYTKWHYEQHAVDAINIALAMVDIQNKKKEDNLSIVFFGAVRRGLECRTEVCVITDEVAQSSNAWCANNRGGNP